jgi:hypothetical protein
MEPSQQERQMNTSQQAAALIEMFNKLQNAPRTKSGRINGTVQYGAKKAAYNALRAAGCGHEEAEAMISETAKAVQ